MGNISVYDFTFIKSTSNNLFVQRETENNFYFRCNKLDFIDGTFNYTVLRKNI